MNTVDFAILGIMGLSCLMGIIRGLTKEVLSLFTWAGSALAAYTLYPSASGLMRSHIANPMIADGVTGATLFITFLIIFGIITVAISNAVKDSMMGGLDRSLGLAFGIFRGICVVCALEIIFSLFIARDKQSSTIQQARFITMVRNGADEIVTMLPASLRDMIWTQTQKIQGIAPLAGDVKDLISHHDKGLRKPFEHLNQSQKHLPGIAPSSSHNQTHLKDEHVDPEKTMEGLSSLKPQATQLKSEGVYDNRQQRELDRLIETSD